MMKDFGSSNAFISKMTTAGKNAKIGNDPVKTLATWSKSLLDDFQCKNVQISRASTNDTLLEKLNQLSQHVCELRRESTKRKANEQSMIGIILSMEIFLKETAGFFQLSSDAATSPKRRKNQQVQNEAIENEAAAPNVNNTLFI